jgi:DNA-binding response OmpR family regulator
VPDAPPGAGFDVRETATGRDALRLARLKPDAIVLDIALPDMNGYEVVRRLKADVVTMAIPVLHKTAVYCGDDDRQRGLAAGADDFLTEPFAPATLVEAVRRLVGRAGRGPAAPACPAPVRRRLVWTRAARGRARAPGLPFTGY